MKHKHRSTLVLAGLAVTAFVTSPASAGVLPVSGTLSVSIFNNVPLGVITLTGTGVGSSAGGTGSAFTVPASLMTASGTVAVTPPALGLSLITIPGKAVNAAGAFAGAPGAQGAMGINGIANFFFTNGAPAGSVPLNYVGGGGSGMATANVPLTIIGATWTNLGINATHPTGILNTKYQFAGFIGTGTFSAFDNRTAGGVGTVQLIAPTVANVFINDVDFGTLPMFGVLTLQYSVPEPGTLLLVGSGLFVLVALGRRKRA